LTIFTIITILNLGKEKSCAGFFFEKDNCKTGSRRTLVNAAIQGEKKA